MRAFAGRHGRQSVLRRLGALAFLMAIAVAALFRLDGLGAAGPAPASASSPSVIAHPGRLFVLVIDSLRWETATEPTLMPELGRLRGRGTSARIRTTRDAVTVPALRAAFTGRDRLAVSGLVRDFLHGEAGLESIFSQARAAGLRAAAYSDGSFLQFGARNLDLLANEGAGDDEVARQEAAFRAALDDFRARRHDLVLVHLTYGDHRAHETGTRSPRYAEAFRRLDALVREADAHVSPEDALAVMGDHGHDVDGRHTLGLDVPTIAVYRGPGYRAGADLGTLPITAHRGLASRALGLPDLDPGAATAHQDLESGIPLRHRAHALMLAACVGVLGLLWAALALDVLVGSGALCAWLAMLAFAAPWSLAWAVAAVTAIAVVTLIHAAGSTLRPAAWLAAVTAAAGLALLFLAWGIAFVSVRTLLHHPPPRALALAWFSLLAGCCMAGRRWGAARAAWAVLGGALLLLFPTAYPYGGPCFVAPAWVIWIVLQCATPQPPLAQVGISWDRHRLALATGAALVLSQFLFPDTHNFSFERWSLAAASAIPHGWASLAAGALIVLFLGPGTRVRELRRPTDLVLACAALALVWIQARGVVFAGAELLLAGALGVASVLSRARAPDRVRHAAWIAAGLLATHALIKLPPEHHLWFDVFLLAAALSGELSRRIPGAGAELGQGFLLVLGIVAVGWSTSAWSMSRLEWSFLYRYLDAATVERHVGALLPLILARFAIPVALVRFAIMGGSEAGGAPERLASLFLGVKALAVLLVAVGTGWVSVSSDIYLEAVQQSGVWLVLLTGLLVWPGSASPRRAAVAGARGGGAARPVPEPAREAMTA